MFDNIGGKIKVLAVVLTWIGIGASIIAALAIWIAEGGFFLGLGVLSGGALAAWLGSFLLYGYGELIETQTQTALLASETNRILYNINASLNKPAPAPAPTYAKKAQPIKQTPPPATSAPKATPVTETPQKATPVTQTTPTEQPKTEVKSSTGSLDEEKLYIYAVQMYNQRSYNIAYNLLSKIPNYKDASEYLEKMKDLI